MGSELTGERCPGEEGGKPAEMIACAPAVGVEPGLGAPNPAGRAAGWARWGVVRVCGRAHAGGYRRARDKVQDNVGCGVGVEGRGRSGGGGGGDAAGEGVDVGRLAPLTPSRGAPRRRRRRRRRGGRGADGGGGAGRLGREVEDGLEETVVAGLDAVRRRVDERPWEKVGGGDDVVEPRGAAHAGAGEGGVARGDVLVDPAREDQSVVLKACLREAGAVGAGGVCVGGKGAGGGGAAGGRLRRGAPIRLARRVGAQLRVPVAQRDVRARCTRRGELLSEGLPRSVRAPRGSRRRHVRAADD